MREAAKPLQQDCRSKDQIKAASGFAGINIRVAPSGWCGTTRCGGH